MFNEMVIFKDFLIFYKKKNNSIPLCMCLIYRLFFIPLTDNHMLLRVRCPRLVSPELTDK